MIIAVIFNQILHLGDFFSYKNVGHPGLLNPCNAFFNSGNGIQCGHSGNGIPKGKISFLPKI